MRAPTLLFTEVVHEDLQTAAAGAGPLLQRDYWALMRDCPLKPSELVNYVKSHVESRASRWYASRTA
jgi:hypothetical protein